MGTTLSETREKLIAFFEAFERGGIKGQNGIIDTFFSKDKRSPLTPELLKDFEYFKNQFNSSFFSAEALAEQMENVDQRIIDYAKTCKNGEMTTAGFKASIDTMSLSAKAGKVALQALAMAGNMLAGIAISFLIKELGEFINKSKRASEAADELYESSQEKVDTHKEEKKSLDELISKYKELAGFDNPDINTRKDIKDIQQEITDLVGMQAKNLDLVNGKLDEELGKLNDISEHQIKFAYETAVGNYYNAKDASDKAMGGK